jgi:hypothetical protein
MAAISSGPCAVRHETRKGLCRDRGRAGRRCEGPDHGAALLRAKATLLLEERLFRLSGGAPDHEQDAANLRQQRHGTLGLGNIAVRVADLLVTNGSFNSVARPPNLALDHGPLARGHHILFDGTLRFHLPGDIDECPAPIGRRSRCARKRLPGDQLPRMYEVAFHQPKDRRTLRPRRVTARHWRGPEGCRVRERGRAIVEKSRV